MMDLNTVTITIFTNKNLTLNIDKMGKKRLPKIIKQEELEKFNTKRLLGYLKLLHQCEESFEKSDMDINLDLTDNELIYFKNTDKWKYFYNLVKSILKDREHIARKKASR